MLLAIIAGAAISQTMLPAQLRGVQRIVMIGDSITQMGGSPDGYVTLVAQSLRATYPNHPIEVVNVGISGHKAPDMLARFQKDVLDRKPQLVTISVGVNDVWHDFRTPEWTARVPSGNSGRGVPLPKFVESVGKMIDLAKGSGARVILLSPTLVYEDLDCTENRRLLNYVCSGQRLAKERKVPFIDLHHAFRSTVRTYQKEAGKGQLLLTTDGVHLNEAGNALVAAMILRALGTPIPNKVGAH